MSRITMPGYGQATFMEKLGVVPVLARAIATAMIHLITAPVRGKNTPNTTLKYVAYGAMRYFFGNTTVAQQQWLQPTTDEQYLLLAGSKGFQPDSAVLPDGSKAHWLGPRSARWTFCYFHGGGYGMPSTPDCFSYLFDLSQTLNAEGHDIAVVMLGYTLTPHATYPTQLSQAVELLRYLVEVEGKDPKNIILGADSAGGNLAVGLLCHLLHPHPSPAVPRFSLSSPLHAAVLISPWLSFDNNAPGFRINAASDVLAGAALERWSNAFLGGKKRDEYNEPISAGSEWWKDLDRVVSNVLVWGGGGEVLVDSIREFGKRLEGVSKNVTTVIEPGACHSGILIDVALKYPKGQGARIVESWMAARL